MKHAKAGFTLMEILLVIAIIGLLAAIVMVGLSGARSKARDAKRLTDLQTIASTLEFYYDSTGHYPIATGQITECTHSGNWIPDGANYNWSTQYIATLPRDPAENCSGSSPQTYSYQSSGNTYQLTTTLENPSPPSTSNQTFVYNGSSFQPVPADSQPIGVSLQSSVSNPTNESPIPIIVTFSRAVVDFSQASLSLVHGIVSGFSQVLASVFNVFVTPTDNNTVVVSINGGAVHDQNGIGNAAAQFTITYDSLLPHAALSPDPLPGSVSGPFSVSVNFTVAVVDFSATSISIANGSVTGFVKQDGSDYTFTVTPTVRGRVSVSVPGGITHSAAGNGNVASNVISTTY